MAVGLYKSYFDPMIQTMNMNGPLPRNSSTRHKLHLQLSHLQLSQIQHLSEEPDFLVSFVASTCSGIICPLGAFGATG
jgi:hypothetical protein